jgi:hypothetical protein
MACLRPVCAQGLQFAVSYPAEAFGGPFNGLALVCLSKSSAQPRFGPNWFHPEPMYSQTFHVIRPGQEMVLDERAVGFPGRLSELPPGEYMVQAVLDRNLGGRMIGASPGNLYSEAVRVTLDPKENKTVRLVCSQVVPEVKFQETERVKEVRLQSKLLSDFYGRPTYLNAAVVLPEAWAKEPDRKFPIVYEVPGFGGRHTRLSGMSAPPEGRDGTDRAGQPFLMVVLDPDCPLGHCVFADSANNGPWGKALTTELIPEVERRFRAIGEPAARFVTGHSSGGWSSLWLQVAYPDVFGGCWSTSPDPVDFRDFQQIDLYAPNTNMFTDSDGKPRPLARRGTEPVLFYKSFSDMERPLRGEQLGSFEAVFSPRGADGSPRKLWNRDTGAVDPVTAQAWRKYDIGLTLRTHWPELEPKLRGKIHVYMGETDTFYLDGAVRLLQKDMKALNADAVIEMVPGDHGSMMTPALRKRIDSEMAAQFLAHYPQH